MNYHQGRNSGPNLDGGEKIRTPMNFVHPCPKHMPMKIIFTEIVKMGDN